MGSTELSPTGTIRLGVYHDSDQTTVIRSLANIGKIWGPWSLETTLVADVISSASVDVRSAPPQVLAPDTVTTASGRSTISNGSMEDQRYVANFKGGWRGMGRAANATFGIVTENDYFSLAGGLGGSYDVLDRAVTLHGGLTVTDNWISSTLNQSLARKLFAVGYTAGASYVMSPFDVLGLRYDGEASAGFESSPYRQVRFGDWSTSSRQGLITFSNTIGGSDGFLEHEPETRTRHSAVLNLLHSFVPEVAIHPSVAVGHDTWDVDSLTAALDLRLVSHWWRMQLGYRLYLQSRANFFEDKYVNNNGSYTYWTSDRNLGDVQGQALRLDITRVILDADGPNDSRLLFHIQADAMHDRYPGFTLLPSLNSFFVSLGFSYEL